MHKLSVWFLIFITGWGIGWFMHSQPGVDDQQSGPVVMSPTGPVEAVSDAAPVVPGVVDELAIHLQGNQFGAVVGYYESLQIQADEQLVANARTRILAYARRLLANRDFSLAEQLLQRFLATAHRDAEARILLAEAYRGQNKLRVAVDQFYEARGYAYRPDTLQDITRRIRSTVSELHRELKRNKDQAALLALYQHLTRMEPDHAPYFMQLAASQLVLDDKESARRSLMLVTHDPGVGAQAQVMLSELDIALADGVEDAAPRAAAEIVGIPLHRSGSHYIVDARPSEAGNIRLLIDTGASLTIFTPGVLEQRGLHYQDTGRTGVFNTANGSVRAPVYTLDALTVGNWQVSQLEIGVLDLGGRSGVDGLLGMNFLKQFQFYIDQDEAMLHLSAGL